MDNTVLHIEWCHVQAQAFHWAEELLLIQEEMQWVLETLWYQADWWESQNGQGTGLSPDMIEEFLAYASKQASLWQVLHSSYFLQWSNAPGLALLSKGAEGKLLGLHLDPNTGILSPPSLYTLSTDSYSDMQTC